jgi:hypothetical protein
MHVRVCPDCGEEFRPEIVNCSDCGALLQDRLEDDETGESMTVVPEAGIPGGEGPSVVEIERRSLYTSNKIREVRPLAERLGSASLRFWVESAGDSWTVLVSEADEEQGRAILNELFGMGHSSAAAFDAESGYAACPACGQALEPRATECPECGLAVGGAPDGSEEP